MVTAAVQAVRFSVLHGGCGQGGDGTYCDPPVAHSCASTKTLMLFAISNLEKHESSAKTRKKKEEITGNWVFRKHTVR